MFYASHPSHCPFETESEASVRSRAKTTQIEIPLIVGFVQTMFSHATLEDFTLKVARTWQLGRKGQNDGVLFLISKSDRKLRIEVGHGLEGSLPDALAGRIIENEVVPLFRAGNFEGGVTHGVDAILADFEFPVPA